VDDLEGPRSHDLLYIFQRDDYVFLDSSDVAEEADVVLSQIEPTLEKATLTYSTREIIEDLLVFWK
jgi:hypothetical protein